MTAFILNLITVISQRRRLLNPINRILSFILFNCNYLYITYTRVTNTPNFGLWNSGKKILMYNKHWLFRICSSWISISLTFHWFILTKNENLHSLNYILEHKIYPIFRTNIDMFMQQAYSKNKLTLGETKL